MSLTAAEVAQIVRLVEESSFDELTLEIDGLKLSLRRNGAGGAGAGLVPTVAAATQTPAVAAPPVATAPPEPGKTSQGGAPKGATPNAGLHEVRSPLLGTFYRAPKPGAAPYVEVGSAVEEDTVVAIIEVMKLMNTVRAGLRGTVSEVLVSDGVLVEYDQPLIRVRPG